MIGGEVWADETDDDVVEDEKGSVGVEEDMGAEVFVDVDNVSEPDDNGVVGNVGLTGELVGVSVAELVVGVEKIDPGSETADGVLLVLSGNDTGGGVFLGGPRRGTESVGSCALGEGKTGRGSLKASMAMPDRDISINSRSC